MIEILLDGPGVDRVRKALGKLRVVGMAVESHSNSSWSELLSRLADNPTALPIVDPYYSGAFDLGAMRAVVDGARTSGCVVVGNFANRSVGEDVSTLVGLGVRAILTMGVDDSVESLARTIKRAVGQQRLLDLVVRNGSALSPSQQMILRWSVRNGTSRTSVSMLARELGISERTLRRRCEALDACSPRDLLAYGRLLHACRLLSHSSMSVESVASILDFSSTSDLLRKFERLTGERLGRVPRSTLLERVARSLTGLTRSA